MTNYEKVMKKINIGEVEAEVSRGSKGCYYIKALGREYQMYINKKGDCLLATGAGQLIDSGSVEDTWYILKKCVAEEHQSNIKELAEEEKRKAIVKERQKILDELMAFKADSYRREL